MCEYKNIRVFVCDFYAASIIVLIQSLSLCYAGRTVFAQ